MHPEEAGECVKARELHAKAMQEGLSDSDVQKAIAMAEWGIAKCWLLFSAVAIAAVRETYIKRRRRHDPDANRLRSQFVSLRARYRRAWNKKYT